MDRNKATVIANHTPEGISIMGVDIYVHSKRLHFMASRRFVNNLNSIPFLDREKVKNEIVKQFKIPRDNISFQ